MTAETLVATLEQDGIRLRTEGGRLKLQAPADRVPGPDTIAGLREKKAAVLEYLRGRELPSEIQFVSFSAPIDRQTDKLGHRRRASTEVERRFGQPHAKLFPFIGRKVRTPEGPGTLIQVFADRVTVLLDSQVSNCAVFKPGEIEPANRDW